MVVRSREPSRFEQAPWRPRGGRRGLAFLGSGHLLEGGRMRLRFHLAAAVAAAAPATAVGGAHFNLNIIGVSHGKSPNMAKGGGDVIFVGLGTSSDALTTKILLSQAADSTFEVLDKNGTDGEASFALPVPGSYTVWARALGTGR